MIAWLPVALLLLATQALGEVPCATFVICKHRTSEALDVYSSSGLNTAGTVLIPKSQVIQIIPLEGDKCVHILTTQRSVTVIGSTEEVKQRLEWAKCD